MSVFILLFFMPIAFCADDPCATYADLPRAAYRGGQCDFTDGKEVCDSTLMAKWYRAKVLDKDLEMQTTPALFGKCGTKFPFWMNGTHPTVENQEVNRTVCMTDLNKDCDSMMHIKVINCGGFFVYKLAPTSACSEGYCFGANEPCPPFDPCDVFEHSPVDSDPGRSAVCGGNLGCDDFKGDTWYKFQTETSNLNISSACPSVPNACGAPLSLWINDTVALSNGTYKHTACVKDGINCCSSTRTVLSKPCKTFSVYNFGNQPMDNCQRVCTDNTGVQCPTPSTSSSVTPATKTEINIKESTTTGNNTAVQLRGVYLMTISLFVLVGRTILP